jgi:hypothetical protein
LNNIFTLLFLLPQQPPHQQQQQQQHHNNYYYYYYYYIQGTDDKGNPQYIHPYNRSQYGAGSTLYGGLNMAIGLCLILLLVHSEKAPQDRNLFYRLLLMILQPLVMLAIAVTAWYGVLRVFTMKQRNYDMGMFLFDMNKGMMFSDF